MGEVTVDQIEQWQKVARFMSSEQDFNDSTRKRRLDYDPEFDKRPRIGNICTFTPAHEITPDSRYLTTNLTKTTQ